MRFVGVYAEYVLGGACGLAGRQEYGGASSLLNAKNRTPPDKKIKNWRVCSRQDHYVM